MGLAHVWAAQHVVRPEHGRRPRAPVLAGGRGLAEVHVIASHDVVHLRTQPSADRGVARFARPSARGRVVHARLPHAANAESIRRSSVCSSATLYPFSLRGAAPTMAARAGGARGGASSAWPTSACPARGGRRGIGAPAPRTTRASFPPPASSRTAVAAETRGQSKAAR